MWTCHCWPLDVSRNVKLPFLTTICLLYICIVVDLAIKLMCCSKDWGGISAFESQWQLWTVKRSLCDLPVLVGGISVIECQWQHWTVKRSLCPLSDIWGVYCKIYLVSHWHFLSWGVTLTFPYIFLLVDCFEWALINCIEKQTVHSELWQFWTGGLIISFTQVNMKIWAPGCLGVLTNKVFSLCKDQWMESQYQAPYHGEKKTRNHCSNLFFSFSVL